MAEWSNAAVLKTVDLHGSGGSNPSLSAKKGVTGICDAFFNFSSPKVPQKINSPFAIWRCLEFGYSSLLQYPSECCPFLKTFSYICSVLRFCRLILHIVKVFFASPLMKMWKFSQLDGRYGTTLTFV